MTAPTLSLHRKLAQVMHEVGRIPKNGTAPQAMGGYKFVQVGDAADAIRKALADQMLTMVPVAVQVVGQVDRPTKSGGTMTTIDLIQTWRITDAESGESIEIQSFGAGADGGDKYSGKAMTSAMKYALLTGFLLSTGEDSELGTAEAGQRPTTASVNAQEKERLAAATDDNGLIGTAIAQGTQDFELRQTPDGFMLPFRVKNGRSSFIVLAEGKLAEALAVIKPRVIDQRVTVWGTWSDESFKKGDRDVTYRVLHLERISTPDGTLPPVEDALANTAAGHEHVDDGIVEAPSAQLFTGPEFEKPDAAA